MGREEPEDRTEGQELPVEVSDDEFDALLESVFTHAEVARRIANGERDSSWLWKEAGKEGADRASLEIMEKFVQERTLTGRCTRGHANRPYFVTLWRNRRVDAYRRMTAPARILQETEEDEVDTGRVRGRRPRSELVGLWNDPMAAVRQEPAEELPTDPRLLDPIIVELMPRVMEVLVSRDGLETPRRTKHTPLQHDATLFVMAVDNGLMEYLDAEQLAFLDSLPERGAHWKRELALWWRDPETDTSRNDQSAVSRAIKRGAEQVLLCMYLFTTLAPLSEAVTETKEMDRLLDILDRPQRVKLPPSERLESVERKRLRTAGERCIPQQDDVVVDVETYLEKTLGRDSPDAEARRVGLEALHASETRFAVLVPQQVSPPQFSCVLHCPTHTPNTYDRES